MAAQKIVGSDAIKNASKKLLSGIDLIISVDICRAIWKQGEAAWPRWLDAPARQLGGGDLWRQNRLNPAAVISEGWSSPATRPQQDETTTPGFGSGGGSLWRGGTALVGEPIVAS